MNDNLKKLIILKKDCNINLGNKCYIKFLNNDKSLAALYNPLIAPKYLKHYIDENNIEEAYLVDNIDVLNKYKEFIYTLKPVGGYYSVTKGFDMEEKYIYFVDSGIKMDLNLDKYFYQIDENNNIILKEKFNYDTDKSFCYVADSNIKDELKDIMTLAYEVIPGRYNISGKSYVKNKKKR